MKMSRNGDLTITLFLLLIAAFGLLHTYTIHAFTQPAINNYNQSPLKFQKTLEVVPEFMGSSETITTNTVWVEEITFGNPKTSGTATIHVVDGNSVDVVPTMDLAAGGMWSMQFQARLANGGLSWTCSGCTNVSAYLRAKY